MIQHIPAYNQWPERATAKTKLWLEGYDFGPDNQGTAEFLGEVEGGTVDAAVKKWLEDNPDQEYGEFVRTTSDGWRVSGRRVLTNEQEAKRIFG